MSNLGLNSSIYHTTKKYADLLNRYLLDAKSESSMIDPEIREKTIEFFSNLIKEDNIDPQIQMIAAILGRDFRHNESTLLKVIRRIINGLSNPVKDVSIIKDLEQIAGALSNESSIVLSRMQGLTK